MTSDTISPAARADLESRIAAAKAARGPRPPFVAEPTPKGASR